MIAWRESRRSGEGAGGKMGEQRIIVKTGWCVYEFPLLRPKLWCLFEMFHNKLCFPLKRSDTRNVAEVGLWRMGHRAVSQQRGTAARQPGAGAVDEAPSGNMALLSHSHGRQASRWARRGQILWLLFKRSCKLRFYVKLPAFHLKI